MTSSFSRANSARKQLVVRQMRRAATLTVLFSLPFGIWASAVSIRQWNWWPELVSIVLSVFLLLLSLLLPSLFQRAYKTHLFFAVSALVCQVPLWHAGLWFIQSTQPPANWIVVVAAGL